MLLRLAAVSPRGAGEGFRGSRFPTHKVLCTQAGKEAAQKSLRRSSPDSPGDLAGGHPLLVQALKASAPAQRVSLAQAVHYSFGRFARAFFG